MGTAIVALALLSVVALIIRKMIKDKKQGKKANFAQEKLIRKQT